MKGLPPCDRSSNPVPDRPAAAGPTHPHPRAAARLADGVGRPAVPGGRHARRPVWRILGALAWSARPPRWYSLTVLAVVAACFVTAAVLALAGCSSPPACHHRSHTCRAVVRQGQVEYIPIIIPVYHPPPPEEDPVEPHPVVVDP